MPHRLGDHVDGLLEGHGADGPVKAASADLFEMFERVHAVQQTLARTALTTVDNGKLSG